LTKAIVHSCRPQQNSMQYSLRMSERDTTGERETTGLKRESLPEKQHSADSRPVSIGRQDVSHRQGTGSRGLGLHHLPVSALLAMLFCIAAVFLNGCALVESQEVRTGLQQISDRDFADAVTTLQGAIDAGQETESAYRALGIAQMGSGDYESAAASLEKALTLSSGIPGVTDYDTNFYLASCYFKLGQADKAIDVYNAILALDSRNTDAYLMRGTAEISEDAFDKADADFRRSIELDSANYDRIITAYQTMDSYGYADAGKKYLSEAIQNHEDMDAYDKGRLSYYLGDYDTAKSCLETTQSNTDYRTTLLLGETYEAQGDMNYAKDLYNAWLAADQTHPEIYNALGICCLKMGDAQSALTAFQAGEQITDGNTIMQALQWGEIVSYENLGEFKKASVAIDSYLETYPEDETAKREQTFLNTR
jgi:tetratricopeptide (TPR) repeat protein